MSKCTAAQALAAFEYWLGYREKETSTYITRRDKAVFDIDAGDKNYTYPGYHCGVRDGAWCAMMVSTALDEACGGGITGAKAVMYGVWPYARCDQLYDAAPASRKGRRDAWEPRPGDVIVFGYSSRDHTGMVYAVDNDYVYTYEGNSGNMCRKRSYPRSSAWIWGYVRPDYADGPTPVTLGEKYGAVCCRDPELHLLSKGCAGPEVASLQALLKRHDYIIDIDGEFGRNTEACVCRFQREHNLEDDGVVGRLTWPELLSAEK